MVERLRALEERFISEIESHPHAATSLVLQNLEALARTRQLRQDYEEDELVTLLLESEDVEENKFGDYRGLVYPYVDDFENPYFLKEPKESCEHGFDCVCDDCSA